MQLGPQAMAGRSPYKITQKDYASARRYIMNAMTRDDISNVDGYMAFRQAETPDLLQAWCDDYLPARTFEKLKCAVIAARKRSRDAKNKRAKIGVDLDFRAHLSLSLLADELDKTLSETILIMEEAYWKAKDAGLLDKTW